ncbi:DUF305 domain-containing protein [Aurantiacibacter marinus]|uniref:DUF305 domain-containing protein n=1 Tax=Aurantiacibacter marinus TaxID=874156 RepID=A0A0H0XRM0_9SPHN|nr:DUF305 domain-containing protein [Aurantiacibacter marinus]KLI65268.1 hypothetical protein AAV99_05325 [Aurantiacibacter marinus]
MIARRPTQITLSLAAMLLASTAPALAQDVRIVQPGAPGVQPTVLSEDEATNLARIDYLPADIDFMQGMIVHHQQAVEMAGLVATRTNDETVTAVAGRIDASQQDEINFMREWLGGIGQPTAMAGMGHADHVGMAGMASPAQLAELAAARGVNFDRLFLLMMINHHEGAITMVDDLLRLQGTATDPVLYDFTSEVKSDQQAEIDRMKTALAALSDDPRTGLAGGLFDAEEAISNLRHVTSLRKPAGFFDPANPSGGRMVLPPVEVSAPEVSDDADPHAGHNMAAMDDPSAAMEAATEAAAEAAEEAVAEAIEEITEPEPRYAQRGGLLSFANTDMAFSGDLMVAGNYHGFNAYRLDGEGVPQLVSSVVCPGGQGDVSIVGNILIMSVEQERGRVDCGRDGVAQDVSEERFRGLRIFDITDIRAPMQVGQVQTCRGSHTHSVVSSDDTRIVVYNSGTAGVRDGEELAGCVGYVPGDNRTALFSIDVIEIPLANPAASRITSSPRVFADDEGNIAGLWLGGDHGDGTQSTSQTNQCHDITVFPALNLAAGACSGNGIIMDISDPYNPVRLDAVTDDGFAYWHSATFNNDGTVVLFTDEWGGGGRPRCQAADPRSWGANAFYEIVDGKLERRGTYKIPAAQSEMENCVAHNGSIIPVPGRDIFVQAWYQGGLSVMDFTDPNNPFEIAYFDRGPIDEDQLVTGGYWSAYWYNGRIYATEIARGVDVFALEPSEHLSAAEIAAAEAAMMGDTFNPQTQVPVTWSAEQIDAVERSRMGG